MDPEVEKLLAHHGIKGMRWGIRRNDAQLRSEGSRTSEDHRRVQELRKKRTHELSNQELKSLNERLNLERQRTQLSPTKVHKGRKAVKNILKGLGIGTPVAFLTSPIGRHSIQSGKEFIKKGKWIP
jgi:integrase